MIMLGEGAVNFHGYQRHSADIDFWIDISEQNLSNLLETLNDLGYHLKNLPEKVKSGQQNISIKISPVFELELITNFNPGKTFEETFQDSILVEEEGIYYNTIGFDDLIKSKITTDRPKDKLDIEVLHKIQLKKRLE
jgi:hypothetical protein